MFSDSAGVKMTIFVDLSKGLMRKKKTFLSTVNNSSQACLRKTLMICFTAIHFFFIREVEYDFFQWLLNLASTVTVWPVNVRYSF